MLDASPAPSFDLDAFRNWLLASGAELMEEINDIEVLRARTRLGILVLAKIKDGRPVGPGPLLGTLTDAFDDRLPIDLTPVHGRRKVTAQARKAITLRDGPGCWYCGGDAVLTIEHLVPRAYGGPNHVSNYVLACAPCNHEAGCLSVAEKVRMREAKRAKGDG